MSRSNIYKAGWVAVQEDDKWVIDSNAIMEKRREEMEAREEERRRSAALSNDDSGEEGFTGGIGGEQIDALLYDRDGEDGALLRASEELNSGPTPEELRAEAEAELEATRAEIEQMKQSAMAEIEAQKRSVLEDAKRQGYNEGLASAQEQADMMRRELEEERRRLEAEYNSLIDELEPKFIDTLTAVYNHIFNTELENERNILVHLIESTLRKVESSRTFIVHVSADDYPYVNMQKKLLAEGAVGGRGVLEVVEDITLRKNECLIETDGGIFDCGVGTQLDELTRKLKLLSFEG
ncbi:MAG: FliH/SctL family protein [Clostridiales bacterium]|nr:FliH/SctL family protein [Clostridiales bacterium]